jgi:DNA-binding NarL/FixJ family response regulator
VTVKWSDMSGVSLPVTRPPGRALLVGQPAFRDGPASALQRRGYVCTEVDEPYDAMVHLCRRPLFYSAVILSLNSLYREELSIISSIKRRFSHVDIWLSDTDGRQAALAEAMRFGADGLLSEDGMHRIAGTGSEPASATNADFQPHSEDDSPPPPASTPMPPQHAEAAQPREKSHDPLLTAEELRALLQESPGSNAG